MSGVVNICSRGFLHYKARQGDVPSCLYVYIKAWLKNVESPVIPAVDTTSSDTKAASSPNYIFIYIHTLLTTREDITALQPLRRLASRRFYRLSDGGGDVSLHCPTGRRRATASRKTLTSKHTKHNRTRHGEYLGTKHCTDKKVTLFGGCPTGTMRDAKCLRPEDGGASVGYATAIVEKFPLNAKKPHLSNATRGIAADSEVRETVQVS